MAVNIWTPHGPMSLEEYEKQQRSMRSPFPGTTEGEQLDRLLDEEQRIQNAPRLKEPSMGENLRTLDTDLRRSLPAWMTPPERRKELNANPERPAIRFGNPAGGITPFVENLPPETTPQEGPTAQGGIADLPPEVMSPKAMPGATFTPATAPPVEQPPAQPQQSSMERAIALYNQLYPQRPQTENPFQKQYQEYMDKEMERTRLMARLAFAGGLTAAGGPGWREIGQGFTNAAQAYDAGHQRYMNALQNGAQMFDSQQNQQYGDEVQRANAISRLYGTFESNALEQARAKTKARTDQKKERREEAEFIFGKDNELASAEEQADRARKKQLYLDTGELVDEIIDDY